ncbi:hypothetical protein TNCV_3846371 [Trichonephila clavipes]|nr:hypothetical protein TNCV_3846371 [Trichonephila clavipes]
MGERYLVRAMLPSSNHSPISLDLNMEFMGLSMILCKLDSVANVQVLQKVPLVNYIATLRSLWLMYGSEADGHETGT